MKLWIACAPGGCELNRAADRLVNRLQERLEDGVATADVEDEMAKLPDTRTLVAQYHHIADKPLTTGEVVYNLNRKRVVKLWNEGLSNALGTLRQSGKPCGLITCHLTLYGGRRREFYAPLDISLLKVADFDIAGVIILFDDVYDMYSRLAREGAIFDQKEGFERHIYEVQDETGLSQAELTALQPILRLEWKSAILGALLAWRHSDMLSAEALANQLGCPYLPFAVKQSAQSALAWLEGHSSDATYLSHPISRPRRELTRAILDSVDSDQSPSPEWPAVVSEFNQLQGLLTESNIPSLMPTAIDEFRIERKPREALGRHPRLTSRWPFPAPEETLYVPVDDTSLGGELGDSVRASPTLRVLETVIKQEIAYRDHHLVAAANHLLVYRPLYDSDEFSQGVLAEIIHWLNLATDELGGNRRAGVLHFESDLIEYMEQGKEELARKTLDKTHRALEKKGFPAKVISQLTSGKTTSSLLDAGAFPPRDGAKYLHEYKTSKTVATRDALAEFMLGVGDELPEGRVGIWISRDFVELREQMTAVASFLTTGETDDTWLQRALAFVDPANFE